MFSATNSTTTLLATRDVFARYVQYMFPYNMRTREEKKNMSLVDFASHACELRSSAMSVTQKVSAILRLLRENNATLFS